MEQQDDTGRAQNSESGSHPEPEHSARGGAPSEAPQVIATDDPVIGEPAASGYAGWDHQPDQTIAVETSQIRGPNEALNPNFVMVPVVADRPRGGGRGEKGGEVDRDEQNDGKSRPDDRQHGADSSDDNDDASGPRQQPREHSSHGPSLVRTLLLAGAVALVCGVVGAWGYSYFFGSKKSDSKESSGKSSSSSSSNDKGSGQDSGSGGSSDSSENSGTRKNSTSSDRASGAEQLVQAEAAWMAAVKELREARSSEKEARRSEADTKAVLSFLKRTLLSAGRPGYASLSEAFWGGGQGNDVSLRKALDRTEAEVAESFRQQPLAEASVRELLGQAYLGLGDAPRAVTQYQRAFALRQAMEGVNHADTAACRNQLAVAYRLAGLPAAGGRLYDRDLDSPDSISALAVRGSMLLREKKPAEAELSLRECLNLREKNQPDAWTTSETRSLLGEALLEQGKYADAEPMLISGYEGLKQHEGSLPALEKDRVTSALQRLVRLYRAWGQPDKEAKWRTELASASASGSASATLSPPSERGAPD